MDILLFVVMTGILIFVTVKNVSLILRYKQNKNYIEAYQNVFHDKENSYNQIKNYIENEKLDEFKNKARWIKLFAELRDGLDYENTINEINLKDIFYAKDKINNSKVKMNSDTFVFVLMDIAKAYEKKKDDAIEAIVKKFDEVSDLDNRLEYQEVYAFVRALTKKEDKGSAFMHSLLDGNYTDYAYEKNMIGLYKRIAAMSLTFNGETIDEYFANDLYSFAKNLIGENFLKSLGMYEKYKPVQENISEESN